MLYSSSYFGRNSAHQLGLNIPLMCIMPPLKLALRKKQCKWVRTLLECSFEHSEQDKGETEIIHGTDNLIPSQRI